MINSKVAWYNWIGPLNYWDFPVNNSKSVKMDLWKGHTVTLVHWRKKLHPFLAFSFHIRSHGGWWVQACSLTPLHTYEHKYAYSQLKSNRVTKNACGDSKIQLRLLFCNRCQVMKCIFLVKWNWSPLNWASCWSHDKNTA